MAQTALQERPANVADFAAPTSKGNLAVVPEPTAPKLYPPKIAKTLMTITREFGTIAKGTKKGDPNGGWNDFHSYGYQKWDDVLDRESTLFQQHGVILQQSEVARSLLDKLISITYEFTIINEDGDVWPDKPVFTAIGRLQDNKGIFDDKAANKCHTQAHKYFLLHFFKIKTKETAEEDSDGEVPDKQVSATKPPKPGSAEAKALEGPRDIMANSAEAWTDAFVSCIATASSEDELDEWLRLNAAKLEKLESHPQHSKRADEAVNGRMALLRAVKAAAPKPPKPGTTPAAAQASAMPDHAADPAGFIVWLTGKYDGFASYEAGETYWNDTIQALDLPAEVQEEAMGVWRRFESKHAP